MISNQNQWPKIATAALTGTSAMTLFSYAVSDTRNKQFREPAILAGLINRLFPGINRDVSSAEGWVVHYAIGIIFSAVYHNFLRKTKNRPSTFTGLLLGAVTGLFGICVWKKVLHLHPAPPALDRSDYYKHLFAAHLIFGLFTAWSYSITETNSGALHF